MRFIVFPLVILVLAGCDKIPGTLEYKAHNTIRSLLKDPDSAQFRNEKLVSDAVCGEVNARNSLGGYVGFRSYYYTTLGDQGSVSPSDVPPDFNEYLRDANTGSDVLIKAATSKIFAACFYQDMHAIFCRDPSTPEFEASKRRCKMAMDGDKGLGPLGDDLAK